MPELESAIRFIEKSRKSRPDWMSLGDVEWEAVRLHYAQKSPFLVPMDEVPYMCEMVRYAAQRPKSLNAKAEGPNMTEVVLFMRAAYVYGLVKFDFYDCEVNSRVPMKDMRPFLEKEIGEPFLNRKNFFVDYYAEERSLSTHKLQRLEFYTSLLEAIGPKVH